MVHLLIFAGPRPDMTEEEFQDYWVRVHAVKYASRIPQVRRYLIDTRLHVPGCDSLPQYSGVAEMWFDNAEELLASSRSKEYVEGARLDEPHWAAFWNTIQFTTDTHVISNGSGNHHVAQTTKLFVCSKRKAGLSLQEFRRHLLDKHAASVLKLPRLRGYTQCHVSDSSYVTGEALLDCFCQLWFDDVQDLEAAMASAEYEKIRNDLSRIAEPKYIHTLATTEHWIIGPDSR